jgi:hypothetical protein
MTPQQQPQIQVVFTPDELKFVYQLIDLSLKTYGANALGPAYILTAKLQMAEQRLSPIPTIRQQDMHVSFSPMHLGQLDEEDRSAPTPIPTPTPSGALAPDDPAKNS